MTRTTVGPAGRRRPMTFKLDPPARRAVISLAEMRGMTPSAFVRSIILSYLDQSTAASDDTPA